MRRPTAASLWRRELARELVRSYARRPGVEMVLLGGSPARGWADRYSDLDIALYWRKLDASWIRSRPLERAGAKFVTLLDMPEHRAMLEIYTLGGLIVELGHATTASLRREIAGVTKQHRADPAAINSLGGFLDALPLHGQERYRAIVSGLPPYPDALARKVVERNAAFFWKGCLRHQGLSRGESVFVCDGICAMIKRLVAILAALNRLYFWPGEPRWIDRWAVRMKIYPQDLWPRLRRMMEGDRARALADLEVLIAEVLALVKKHMPEADLSRVRQFEGLEVRATERPPSFGWQRTHSTKT
ncbi:MAG: hypothetical protein MUF78_05165 [Candidatus Edwardsbacteria bacterium]|nr:hypothetical protein [Candidatus Edwardsbacteria bacterium]